MFKNGLHGKPNKRKKSAKYSIAQTIFDSDENSRLWNDEYERTSNWIQSKINVSFSGGFVTPFIFFDVDILILNRACI